MRKIKCPSCGAINDVIADNQPCAFCGTTLTLPKPERHADGADNGPLILPISPELQTREGVIESFKRVLVETDNIPLDIFDHLEIDSVEWYYLPFFRFRGNITASWSCTQIIERKRISGYRPVKDYKGNTIRQEAEYEYYDEYFPMSGTGYSALDEFIPCGGDENLPASVRSQYYSKENNDPYLDSKCESFSVGNDVRPSDAAVTPDSLSADSSVIREMLQRAIDAEGEACSFGNVPRYKDGHYSASFNKDGVPKMYFMPFVRIVYKYRGQQFECAFFKDDHDCYLPSDNRPVSEDESASELGEKLERKLKHLKLSRSFIWVLFPLLFAVLSCCVAYRFFDAKGLVGIAAFIIGIGIVWASFGRVSSKAKAYTKKATDLYSSLEKDKRMVNLCKTTGKDCAQTEEELSQIECEIKEGDDALGKFKSRCRIFWVLVILLALGCAGMIAYNQEKEEKEIAIDGKTPEVDVDVDTKEICEVAEEEVAADPAEQYANEGLSTGTFRGPIDGKYSIVMRLTVDGNNIRGKYAYESTLRKYGDVPSSWFKLTGTKLPDGYVRLISYLPDKTPGVDEGFERFELSFDDSGLSGHLQNIKQGTVLSVDLYP